ncbi:MAG: hypothetical protein AAFX94_16445 [Myxococcota bacterium]
MTTSDEIDLTQHRRRRKRRETLEEVSAQYTDKQTMQLTAEHLQMLSDLAEGRNPIETDTDEVDPNDTQPVTMEFDRPRVLIDEDPDEKA